MHVCAASLEGLGALIGLLPLGLWQEVTGHCDTHAVKMARTVGTGL